MKARFGANARLAVLALALAACAADSRGQLSLAALDALKGAVGTSQSALDGAGTSQSAPNGTAYTFQLGELRASRDFYFILRNGGNADVEDVALSIDNSAFVLSPTTIERIPALDTSSVAPIVRVRAVHGRGADGLGFAPLMPMGESQATLTITGSSAGDLLSLSAIVTVDAKVMDVELRSGAAIDLSGWGISPSSLGGLGYIRHYFIRGGLTLTNIGNVDIEVKYFTNDRPPVTAHVGETIGLFTLPRGFVTMGFAGGAITDNERLQLGNDGIAYLSVGPSNPMH
jgi:hypothetical protein